VIAHEAGDFYGDLLRLTKGIIFMGTPHRGSDLVPWSLLISNLINVASFGRGIRKDLLKNLEKDGKTLIEISNQFVHRSTPLRIMSLVEQQVERPLNTLVCMSYTCVKRLLLMLGRWFPKARPYLASQTKWLSPSMRTIVECAVFRVARAKTLSLSKD